MAINSYMYCLVCGYTDGSVFENTDICPCCFAECGFDDNSLEDVRAYRQEWLNSGGKWHDEIHVKEVIEELVDLKQWADQQTGIQKDIPIEQWKQDTITKSKAPPGWNREEQMKNIPPEWL